MALMGLLEPVWRLPLVPPKPENLAKIRERARIPRAGPAGLCCTLKSSGCSTKIRRSTPRASSRSFSEFKDALNAGEIRAAEPDASAKTGWRVNAWVKKGILLGFRMGATVDMSIDAARAAVLRQVHVSGENIHASSGVRIVPGGSSIRDGCYIGKGVTCMPPMYINVGAYVDEGTMVDSHALVGSCAQIGKNCHISAAAQIGGVLEPIGALPVIIEDEVLVGGNCGVYEGTVVKRRAVLGTRHNFESLDARLRSGRRARFTRRATMSRW